MRIWGLDVRRARRREAPHVPAWPDWESRAEAWAAWRDLLEGLRHQNVNAETALERKVAFLSRFPEQSFVVTKPSMLGPFQVGAFGSFPSIEDVRQAFYERWGGGAYDVAASYPRRIVLTRYRLPEKPATARRHGPPEQEEAEATQEGDEDPASPRPTRPADIVEVATLRALDRYLQNHPEDAARVVRKALGIDDES